MSNYTDYDFKKHQGINPATAAALKRRFGSWEEIANASAEQLKEVPGIGDAQVDDLWDSAKAQIRLAKTRQNAGAERVLDVSANADEELYVLSSKPADYAGSDGTARVLNVKRRRKLLVPCICPKCGIDFAERKGIAWDRATATTKQELTDLVAAHIAERHGLASQQILTKSQMESIGA